MSHSTTLNEAIETVSSLPQQQQEMLLEICRHRMAEARREEIANAARKAKADFSQGRYKGQSADALIQELHQGIAEE